METTPKTDWESVGIDQLSPKSGFMKATEEFTEVFRELMEFRERTAGMVIVDQDAYQRLQAERGRLRFLARMHSQTGEARACSIFDHLYINSILPNCIPVDGIELVREHPFSTGRRVDRIIKHASGRLSIVEIKDACDQRSVVAGIGQALLYATLAERDFFNSSIVPVLAVLGDYDEDVARACERGGVEYVSLGNIQYLKILSQMTDLMIN